MLTFPIFTPGEVSQATGISAYLRNMSLALGEEEKVLFLNLSLFKEVYDQIRCYNRNLLIHWRAL